MSNFVSFYSPALPSHNPFPSWCPLNPVVDNEIAEIIRRSWDRIKTGESQGYRDYTKLDKEGGAKTVFDAAQSVFNARSSVGGEKKAEAFRTKIEPEAKREEDAKGMAAADERKVEKKEPYESPLIPAKEEGYVRDNLKKSPFSFFFDNFYDCLYSMAPNLRLYFTNNAKIQSHMLAQLCNFVVLHAGKMKGEEFEKKIFNLAKTHNSRRILPEYYDLLGTALLLSLKATLGNDFTNKEIEAWTLVYSDLLHSYMPFVDPGRKHYIARKIELGGIGPIVKVDMADDEKVLRKEAVKPGKPLSAWPPNRTGHVEAVMENQESFRITLSPKDAATSTRRDFVNPIPNKKVRKSPCGCVVS